MITPIDFMEFINQPCPESIGAFIAKHDKSVSVCEHCKGHGVIPKPSWELCGGTKIPYYFSNENQQDSGSRP